MDKIIFCDDVRFDDNGDLEIFYEGVLYRQTASGKTPVCYGADKMTLFDGKILVEYGNGFYLQ